MKQYSYDVVLRAKFTVRGANEEAACESLKVLLRNCELIDDNSISGQATLEGEPNLTAINGKAVG